MSLETPTTANSDLEELRVVWMIRDCGELLFYLDYVHQLVKSQNSLSRHVVYVDVYITGLGKGVDPVQMVAQTLFLLTVSDLTSAYMNIHFGRPDLSDVFAQRKPKQVKRMFLFVNYCMCFFKYLLFLSTYFCRYFTVAESLLKPS